MSLEQLFERQAAALESIASTLAAQLDVMRRAYSPQGETVAVEPETAQVVDLTAKPIQPEPEQPQPVNDTESLQPAAGVTKRTLWATLQDTYNALAAVNRGPEIGELLSQYQAMHIDQLSPSDYMAVHAGLLQLKESVNG